MKAGGVPAQPQSLQAGSRDWGQGNGGQFCPPVSLNLPFLPYSGELGQPPVQAQHWEVWGSCSPCQSHSTSGEQSWRQSLELGSSSFPLLGL